MQMGQEKVAGVLEVYLELVETLKGPSTAIKKQSLSSGLR